MSVPAFIDLSEADQVAELQEYFSSKDIEVEKSDSKDLFDDVRAIISATSKLWENSDSKEIEGIVNSILSLLFIIPINRGQELVDRLCDQLHDGASKGKASLSLKLLHNLFHGYPIKTPFLYKVYCTWVKVAGRSSSIHLVPTNLTDISAWIQHWNVGEEGRQTVLRLLYEAQYDCERCGDAAATMVRLLEGYSDDNAAQAREDAVRCITRALCDQNTYLFDHLLALKPVKFLEGELLHELLNIFVNGEVDAYKDFHANNTEFIKSIGLSYEKNLRKMQLLTLVDIVGVSREITYDDITSKLGISKDDVEGFVIDAIQSKLIRARIDHVNRKVLVSQACQRTFGRPQWQLLSNRLQRWKDNLRRVNDKLATVQVNG